MTKAMVKYRPRQVALSTRRSPTGVMTRQTSSRSIVKPGLRLAMQLAKNYVKNKSVAKKKVAPSQQLNDLPFSVDRHSQRIVVTKASTNKKRHHKGVGLLRYQDNFASLQAAFPSGLQSVIDICYNHTANQYMYGRPVTQTSTPVSISADESFVKFFDLLPDTQITGNSGGRFTTVANVDNQKMVSTGYENKVSVVNCGTNAIHVTLYSVQYKIDSSGKSPSVIWDDALAIENESVVGQTSNAVLTWSGHNEVKPPVPASAACIPGRQVKETVGANPSDCKNFKKYMKILGSVGFDLAAGAQREENFYYKFDKIIDMAKLQEMNPSGQSNSYVYNYLKGTTTAIMAVVHGYPGKSTAGGSGLTYLSPEVGFLVNRKYTFKGIIAQDQKYRADIVGSAISANVVAAAQTCLQPAGTAGVVTYL